MYGIIYKIKNKINGKLYIGQTTDTLKNRWKKHQYKSNCILISRAIAKYGIDNFEVTVISKCNSLKELNEREQFSIRIFKSLAPLGYNLDTGGKNKRLSAETKAKISLALKGENGPFWGKHHTKEAKEKISKAHLGRKASPETRAKMSMNADHHKPSEKNLAALRKALTGVPKTDSHKNNLSKAHAGKILTKEHKQAISDALPKRKIICNETGEIYSSFRGAIRQLNTDSPTLWNALKNKRKNGKPRKCKGFTFSYVVTKKI